MPTAQELIKIGKALEPIYKAKSAGAIRKFLKKKRIKGDRTNPFTCPIATYLTKASGQKATVASYIEVGSVKLIKRTEAIRVFMVNFDTRDYPELDNNPDKHYVLI